MSHSFKRYVHYINPTFVFIIFLYIFFLFFAERPIYSSESEDSGGSDLDDARAKRLSKAKRLDDSDSDHKVRMLAKKLLFAIVQGQASACMYVCFPGS